MATTSYPAVGDGGLTDAQWASMYGNADGIIEDYNGNDCSYFRYASTDYIEIRPGKVSVNGYVLDIETAEQLYVPPVRHPNPPITYYIAAVYDPARNVAEPDGTRSELGPCRLELVQDLNTESGRAYTILYQLIRSSISTLNETEISDQRTWLGRTGQVAREDSRGWPLLGPGVDYPKGSRLFCHATDNEWWRVWNPYAPGLMWLSTRWPPMYPLPLPSTLTAYDTPAQFYQTGCEISFVGTVRRANGNPLSDGSRDVTICTMPEGYRPFRVQRFQVPTSREGDVEITCFASGNITVRTPTEQAIAWVDLSSIRYRTMKG